MKYKEYKKVDLPWISEVPSHWEIKRLKNVAEIYTGNSISDNKKDNYTDNIDSRPYISTKDISKDSDFVDYNNGMYIKINDNSFKVAKAGATIVCIEGGSGGEKVAYIDRNISFVNKLCCIKSVSIIDKFIYFLIKSNQFKIQYSMSIAGDRNGVSLQKLGQFNFPIPPKEEQERIACFLDWKISEIDRLIEIYKKRIININSIKGQLISNEYQKSESKIRLKMLLKNSMEYGLNMSGNLYGDYRYVRITDIDKNGRLKNDNLQYVSNIEDKYILRSGDLLFARSGATVGKTYYYKNSDGNCAYAGYLIRARLNEKMVYPEYVYYFIQSNDYKEWKDAIFIQSTIQNINAEKYSNLLIPFTDKDIQKEIIGNCEQITDKTNIIEQKYISQIQKLQQLKQSLISDAVTGRLDVRNLTIPDFEPFENIDTEEDEEILEDEEV